MVEPNRLIDSRVADRELVLQFFAYFSRFEYSLKRAGFLKSGAKAEPNWDTYANTLRGRFADVHDSVFRDAVTFLLKEPPKTQTVSGKSLDWRDTVQKEGEQHERYVLRLVRTIRNNLFHGGKYPLGPVHDVARDRDLLKAGIVVLGQCLELSERVRASFEEAS
jgi:hypothetical protein